MSFREKSAWITFLTVLLTAGAFFNAMLFMDLSPHERLTTMIACAVGLVALQVVLHVAAAIMNPADARSPKDEREKAIERRAYGVGYWVLVAGVAAMFVTGHMTFSASAVLYNALAALTAAALAIALTQIVLFRLGR